jgi:hypothetical protein
MSTYQLSPSSAWACSAATSGGFTYSSNTGPTSVTVCAKSVTTSRTVAPAPKAPVAKAPVAKAPVAKAPTSKTPVTKATPKPSPTPVKVTSLLSPIKKGIPVALQKPVAKPVSKPAPKPSPKPAPRGSDVLVKSSAKESTASSTGEVSFSPAPIFVSASAPTAVVGQAVGFWANASTHYKTGFLLGKITDVRFTPIHTAWSSDRGQSGAGASISLSFELPGRVEVGASVTYAVAYQISGASGWVSSGEIMVSDSVGLTVEGAVESTLEESPDSAAAPPKVVRLVGENCHSRTTAFGCNP